jgi:hypothetical protein
MAKFPVTQGTNREFFGFRVSMAQTRARKRRDYGSLSNKFPMTDNREFLQPNREFFGSNREFFHRAGKPGSLRMLGASGRASCWRVRGLSCPEPSSRATPVLTPLPYPSRIVFRPVWQVAARPRRLFGIDDPDAPWRKLWRCILMMMNLWPGAKTTSRFCGVSDISQIAAPEQPFRSQTPASAGASERAAGSANGRGAVPWRAGS